MHIRLSAKILISLFASIFIVCIFLPIVEATTETRYFRSDSTTVNGLNCRKLLTSKSGTAFNNTISQLDPEYEIQRMYLGSRVWKRSSESVETEITSGTPIGLVYRASIGLGLQTATWACPQTTVVSTDSIVIRVYYSAWDSTDGFWGWILINTTAIWQTGQLGTTILNSATWTFQYYTMLQLVPSPKRWTWSFLGDTATYDSKITGITWGEAPSTSWRDPIVWTQWTYRNWSSAITWEDHFYRNWSMAITWENWFFRNWSSAIYWTDDYLNLTIEIIPGWQPPIVWQFKIGINPNELAQAGVIALIFFPILLLLIVLLLRRKR